MKRKKKKADSIMSRFKTHEQGLNDSESDIIADKFKSIAMDYELELCLVVFVSKRHGARIIRLGDQESMCLMAKAVIDSELLESPEGDPN